jgi:head-tail adaptor
MTSLGQRDTSIRIERGVEGPASARGEAPITWSLQREVHAHIRMLSGKETVAAQQLAAFQTRVFNVLYTNVASMDPFPNPGRLCRLVAKGSIWNIEQANPIPNGRPKEIDFVATARAEAEAAA